MNTSTLVKEKEFHDGWAKQEDFEKIKVKELFDSPVAMENKFILEQMGDLKGKRLLDIGAGLGESSVYFALKGAKVTAVDLSPEMVRLSKQLATRFGVEIEGVVAAAESLNVGREQFDIVYAANILHHVTNKDSFYQQIEKALVKGGKVYTFDPLCYNPVINVYRNMATEVRTEDEAPLSFEDVRLFAKYFKNVTHREFWLSTLVLFVKYYLVGRVHPNQERYWKKIFNETRLSLWWWYPLKALDSILTRLPLLRRLSWNMVMVGEKA